MGAFDDFLNKSTRLKNYKDSILKGLVCEYLRQRYQKDFNVIKSRAQKAITSLSDFLSDRSVEDITAQTVTEALKNSNRSFKEVALFLIYAQDKGNFKDSQLNSLNLFKEYIEQSSITNNKLAYIINIPEYERFLTSPLYNHLNEKKGMQAFLFELDKDSIYFKELLPILENYVTDKKYKFTDSPDILVRKLNAINICTCFLYGESGTANVTSQTVLAMLDSVENSYTASITAQVYIEIRDLISYLISKEVISDPNLVALSNVSSGLKKFTKKEIQRILTSKTPEKFHTYKVKRGSKTDRRTLIYIDAPPEIGHIITDFLSEYARSDSEISILFGEFIPSLQPIEVTVIDDLSFNTFLNQVKYFSKFDRSQKLLSILIAFYLYVQQNYIPDLFQRSGVPDSILHRSDLGVLLLEGYEIATHNPLAPVPDSDKWILCYSKSPNSSVIDIKRIDFTIVNCITFRNWLKNFVWYSTNQMETKTHPIPILSKSLNYLYNLKMGEEKSIFTRANKNFSIITSDETAAFRNWVFSQKDNNRTQSSYIYTLRSLLQFVDDYKLGEIEKGVFYNLANTQDQEYLRTEPIPDEDLEKLSEILKARAKENNVSSLYYSIFYIALETELRGISILNLQKDCVRETAKKGEYVIALEEKTSAGEIVYHPVTQYVVREIREVIKRTEEYRQACNDNSITNVLFIIPGRKNNSFQQVNAQTLNLYLKSCCNEAGIKEYTLNNVRYTHMTKAEQYKIRRSLSEMEQSILTGHKSSTTDDIHYVRLDIREMLESVHGILIGNDDIRGTVSETIDDSISTNDNLVSFGCGYCKSPQCHEMTYIDCLICKDFITMPSRIPFFEERISMIDKQIKAATIAHDKEDLVNIKKLLVMYLEKLLSQKEMMLDGAN